MSHFEVFRREDGYVIVSREYGIVVRNANLEQGVAELEGRIDVLRQDFESLGLPITSSVEKFDQNREPQKRRTVQRAVVIGSIMIVLVIAAAYPAVSFLSSIRQSISSILPQAPGVDGAGRLAIDTVKRLADATDQITPERERELQQSLNKIARKVAPLMRAVLEPFDTPPGQSPNSP